MRRILTAAFFLGTFAASAASAELPEIQSLASPVTVRLRGLSAVSDDIAWASGREGTVLRTVDAGKTWGVFKVPGAEKLDFRDVEGFSADEAVILSIGPGEDSRVYRTRDGGRNWALTLQSTNPNVFFDCFSFDGREGRLLGDPTDGKFQIYRTSDAGSTWSLMDDGPEAEPGEAAFAASGTCILYEQEKLTIFATGGAVARAHYLLDDPEAKSVWIPVGQSDVPSSSATGFFSITPMSGRYLMVGGDYEHPLNTGLALRMGASYLHFLQDSKKSIPPQVHRSGNDVTYFPEPISRVIEAFPFVGSGVIPGLRGYRSGSACLSSGAICVVVGPEGNDSFQPETETWSPLTGRGYDSVDVAGRTFWFSGDGGRLGRLILPE
ncbi:WD40/YVTN/BNR-like repeat-containing protein [Arenimonas oryziterrae]|uniref:Photosynthesis system II assembly factor Ycf48/Hcf136-like domain-containing protein n=1 Tax=Arenimonas oryziterrae DSM 21050 = YC6267 TaxID=1121015 RepID=A0A091AXY4_9GAMM|nr:hypothetical protein [Arenimonas oryziterrae]KFN44306.1 hypothetical protein N789_06155 [Arenimonas oryziterrae DSM 21050 = YC6267]